MSMPNCTFCSRPNINPVKSQVAIPITIEITIENIIQRNGSTLNSIVCKNLAYFCNNREFFNNGILSISFNAIFSHLWLHYFQVYY